MDNSLNAANDAVVNFTATMLRKTIELQTSMFGDFISLGKTLVELTPAKNAWVERFTNK